VTVRAFEIPIVKGRAGRDTSDAAETHASAGFLLSGQNAIEKQLTYENMKSNIFLTPFAQSN
jgi:hypothetical protein